MARSVPIEQKYTLTPDKAPDPGSLGPGEVAWELASNPIKQWIGVPASINSAERLLVTPSEPAMDGAYLRIKDGDTYAWENRIVRTEKYFEESFPVLDFIGNRNLSPLFAVESYGGATGATFSYYGSYVSVAWEYVGKPAAAMMYALGSTPALWIDNAGDRSGLYIDSDGPGSRGVEIQRGPDAGPDVRFTHKPVIGSPATPAEYVLGDIVFTGITERHAVFNQFRRGDSTGMRAVSTQPWSPTARGSRLEFLTTPNGTQAPRKSLVIDHDGGLHVMYNGALTALDSLLGGTGGLAAPTGPLVSSNGTELGSLAVGDNLGVTGTFPSQTLRVTLQTGATEHATWLGVDALASLRTTGSWEDNVAIGNGALMSCSAGGTASGNTAVGAWVLWRNTNAGANTGVGFNALSSNILGGSNTALGNTALGFCVDGSQNVAIGSGAGTLYSTGGSFHLTSPERSIYIGADNRSAVVAPNNEIVIGANAVGNGSNTITLGNNDIIATYLRGDVYINGVRLELGDPDSAGAGYRVLRVPN